MLARLRDTKDSQKSRAGFSEPALPHFRKDVKMGAFSEMNVNSTENETVENTEAEDEAVRKEKHEASEAQRKAEWEARIQAKKDAEQKQLDALKAMSDDEIILASNKRIETDTEKLTRRNMKECVSEHIQMACFEDPAFARLVMHPRKSMIRCFQYINRKAYDYIQDELKANGIKLGIGAQGYGSDIPDDLCYTWAEEYFRDPTVKEDQVEEEKFVPVPYKGKSAAKTKKVPDKKYAPVKADPAKTANEEQLSFDNLFSQVSCG